MIHDSGIVKMKIVLLLSISIVFYLQSSNVVAIRHYLGMGQSILENFEIQDADHLIHTASTDSVIICMYVCTQNTQCLSFSYNAASLACRLYDAVYGSEEKGTPMTGTRHYNVGENGK